MTTEYKIETDGSITITTKLKPEGSLLEQEEQIAAAVSEMGRIETVFSMKSFDTQGQSAVCLFRPNYTTHFTLNLTTLMPCCKK